MVFGLLDSSSHLYLCYGRAQLLPILGMAFVRSS